MTDITAARESARLHSGRFGEQEHSAPEFALGSPDDARLLNALHHWGLTDGDLPGIREAWAEKFTPLDSEPGEGLPEAARAVLGVEDVSSVRIVRENPDGSLVAEVSTLRGDKYEDEEETVRYMVPAGESAERLLAADANTDARRVLSALRTERQAYEDGEQPPWRLLADPEAVAAARAEAQRTMRASSGAWRLDALVIENDAMGDFLHALEHGEPLDKKWFVGNHHDGFKATNPPARQTFWGHQSTPRLSARDVNNVATDYGVRRDSARRLTAAMAQAQALPDGELKAFLVGEREARSYSTTEGTGRQKKTVTKTYTPVSDLVSDEASAVKSLAAAETERAHMLAQVSAHQQQLSTTIAELSTAVDETALANTRYYELGWPGDPEQVPPRPERGNPFG